MVVTAAKTDDRVGLVELMTRYFEPGVTRLPKVGVDQGSHAQ